MRIDFEKIDVYEFLDRLGVDKITDLGDEYKFCCPFHGETNPSACINKTSTAFICFACGARGNAITFLSQIENVTPMQATRWLREWAGDDWAEPQGGTMVKELDERWTKRELVAESLVKMREVTYDLAGVARVAWIDEAAKPQPVRHVAVTYMLDRGFDPAVCAFWGLGFHSLTNRLAIPIHDHVDVLVGFKARAIDHSSAKYMVLEPRYEASKIVFGMGVIPKAERRAILCEGELNVIAMHAKGFTNAVGISGSSLSDAQARLIAGRFDEITLIFDCDDAGTRGVLGWVDNDGRYHAGALAKLEPYCRMYVTGEHDRDPGDMSTEEVHALLAHRESSLNLMIK